MSKLKYVMMSVLLGLLAGLLFIFIAILLDISLEKFLPATTFPAELPIGMSFIVIAFIFFFIIRKAEKKIAITAMVLLILSSIYSVCVVGDLILIGPGPEQLTYMHLLAKLRDEKGSWVGSEWNFYKPRCYITFCAKRYGNTSLEVAVFYYGYYGKSAYNPHSVLKYLFTKLFCGITDSKTAYENYKRFLSKSRFLIKNEIKNETNNFVAENKTVTVYCQLDGDFITVVKVNKNEEYLLNKGYIEKSLI